MAQSLDKNLEQWVAAGVLDAATAARIREWTVPKKGPPRPIRLAVKRGETFTPLSSK